MPDDTSFGRWLKQRRKELNLTQDDLARRVGCALITLQKIEADERRPSVQIAERLAEHLDIALAEWPAFLAAARREGAVELLSSAARDKQLSRPPNRLPSPPTPLIGRHAEAADVHARLLRDTVRLVTLVGAPGIGKTRLGIQVASEVQYTFADGAYFVVLAPIRDPALVAATILQAIGFHKITSRPFWEVLAEQLRDKQILLLLDNFEQLLPSAPMLAELLASCPQLKLLVTSRAVLQLSGEHIFSVPPLTLPDSERPPALADLPKYAAIQLFVQRVQALRADFVLTEANAAVVVEICRRLDGLPLAIELAAARSKLFAPQALLQRLKSCLTLLTSGAQDLPVRQQTLRNAIAWSYDLLEDSEQALFRRLAVFVGGCDLAAVESVCDASGDLAINVLDGVASLVDQSLVQRELDTDGEPRFTLLETLCEYGLEQLDVSGEAGQVRHRHAEYYLQLAESAEPELRGEQQIIWLERLAREHNNLRVALRWALNRGELEIAARIAVALPLFWYTRGHHSEERHWLAAVLEHGDTLPEVLQAKVLRAMSSSLANQGELEASRSFAEASLELYRRIEDTYGIAIMLVNLGATLLGQDEKAQASKYLEEGLSICRRFGYKHLMGIVLNNLGYLELDQGEYEQATARIEESVGLMREIKNTHGVAAMLHSLGELTYIQGDHRQAKIHYVESLQLCREVGFVQGTIGCLIGLAGVTATQGQMERAARLCGVVEALTDATGVTIGLDRITHTILERTTAMLCARLGATTFAALLAEGQAMSPEEAIAEALRVEA